MAPEQARGEPVDARADRYALGCVLYEMVVGHAPFAGSDAAEVLEAHASAPVPPIDSPHGPIPAELARVVRRAMSKRPEDRYQAASEMIADLIRAADALGPVGWRRWQS
jgi:serine/threonine-protein kinase